MSSAADALADHSPNLLLATEREVVAGVTAATRDGLL